jgi:hypothetical protein
MMKGIRLKEGKEETVQSYLGVLSHGNSRHLQDDVNKLAQEMAMPK